MKVGILTHYNVSSHGALLQMYGLKKALEEFGHEVFILTYTRNLDFIDEATKKRFSASIKNIPYYLSSYMGEDGLGCLFYQFKKQQVLKKFREDNFKMLPYTESAQLDCVIVGADEVFSLENGVNFVMFGHGITSPMRPVLDKQTLPAWRNLAARNFWLPVLENSRHFLRVM